MIVPTTASFDEPITVLQVDGVGTEDVLVSPDGRVYTGTEDGHIHEIDPKARTSRVLANTHGRPLGLEWLPNGHLLVCDSKRGLLEVDLKTATVSELVTEVSGRPMLFCNNAAVHSDGSIYFSDSSRLHGQESWKSDMIEDTHTGRLLVRRPDGSVSVQMDGLRFANGVTLAADESYVAVAQTTGRDIARLWLSGPRSGVVEPFITDLPGYPDNIARGSDGLIWVALASPTDPALELMLRRVPLGVRRRMRRLPEKALPGPKRSARVMAFDDRGRLVHDRQLVADHFHMVTGVREHDGRVWLGSLQEPAVATFAVWAGSTAHV